MSKSSFLIYFTNSRYPSIYTYISFSVSTHTHTHTHKYIYNIYIYIYIYIYVCVCINRYVTILSDSVTKSVISCSHSVIRLAVWCLFCNWTLNSYSQNQKKKRRSYSSFHNSLLASIRARFYPLLNVCIQTHAFRATNFVVVDIIVIIIKSIWWYGVPLFFFLSIYPNH